MVMPGSRSINDDLHHCGFITDDEYDNVEADGDGIGNGDSGPNMQLTPTNVPPPTRGSPTPSTASTDAGGTGKRRRMLTSDVWQYFDVLNKDVRGNPVRYGAHCKFCEMLLSSKSSSVTGHLLRHVKSCVRK
jgi:hypothetical protein